MRIVQLGPFPPPHGGVQTNVVAIREYVRKHGIGCAVINLNRFRRPDADEVYYPKTAFQVLKLLGRLPSDIIHIHYGGKLSLRLQVMGLICTLMPGKKTVMTFHSGGYPSSPEGRRAHFWSFRAFVFRRFDALIGVNQEILDLFQKMGVHPERTQLIYPHYVGPGAASADLPERARAFFQSHQPLLLTVGLLEPEYDLKLQIDSLEQVRKRHPQAGLVIAGAGSLASELSDHISSKPYANHVLLYGDMPHPVTLRAIRDCSALLRTTLYDGDSVAVREALHLGTPVIATDNLMRPPGVHLIPAQNAQALVAAIDCVLAQPRPRASEESSEANLAAVLNMYRRVTA
jgi:glycosyltransferase involved in cell wall biosynthesis